jgi:hypothetical protein
LWFVCSNNSVLCVVIFASAKIPQILKGFREKNTGQLDLFMVIMQLLGSVGKKNKNAATTVGLIKRHFYKIVVRVFTTMQSVDDPLYLLSYIIGSTLNAVLVFQVLFYGNQDKQKKKKQN